MKTPNVYAIIVTLLLLATCIVATVAENCRVKNNVKCANGSTIALTVTMALLIAVTSIFWFKPVYFPEVATVAPIMT